MEFDFTFCLEAILAAVKYIPVTLQLALFPLLFGLILGTLLAFLRMSKNIVLRTIAQIYITVVRGIPPILMIMMSYLFITKMFDGFAEKFGWEFTSAVIPTKWIAIIALTISAIAFLAEAVRSAVLSVNPGQLEAAYSIGMTKFTAMVRIVLPQALPSAIPIIGNQCIGLIKASSLAYFITVMEVFNAAKIAANRNYKMLEAYVAAALIYWALTLIVERITAVAGAASRKHLGKELA